MNIELLYINDCPNSALTAERIESALTGLDSVGSSATFRQRLMAEAADTVGAGFAGSPTILVNGEDLFPGGAVTEELACRVYQTPGGLAGAPTEEQISSALRALL